jgi:hypothetical protein
MPPQLKFAHFRFREIGGTFCIEIDKPGTDVGPPDVDGENRVMRLKGPRWCELERTKQARLVGAMSYRPEVNLILSAFRRTEVRPIASSTPVVR